MSNVKTVNGLAYASVKRVNGLAHAPSVATLSSDTFNRTNSTTNLSSTDGAGTLDPLTWTQQSGTWGIISNTAYCPTPGGTFDAAATVDLATANVDLSLTTTTLNGGSGIGIVFRYVDATHYWVWQSESSTRLFKKTAGTYADAFPGIAGAANGDVLRVVANGSAISAYRNGALQGTVTDSAYSTATKHGLWVFFNNSGRLDNWSALSLDGSIKTIDGLA